MTDNYVLCSITIKNKKILFADISMLEDEKDVRKFLNVMKEPSQSMYVESDASYAMYLLDKSIRWHRKNNYPLPPQMQKYFPIISVPYDRAMKRPFSHIYNNEEFMNYQFYNEYIGNLYEKEALFSTWLVPQKIIAAFAKELESLTQGVIELPKEQMTDRAREIMKKYIDEYWTEPRKKEFAFKLHHMSYYLYNKDKEFLSRLCFSASLKMRAKEIKPSQNAFAEVMFAFSFSFYRAYQEQMKKKKQILIPGKDSQGIILPGK